MWDLNLTELFQKGGVVMWPLLACSVLGLAIMLERTVVVLWNSARFQSLVDHLRGWVQSGKIDEAKRELARSRGTVPRVALAYLQHLDSPAELREEVVAREASRHLTHLEN